MQIKPVKHYPEPGFPTRGAIDERPEILMLVPRRWRTNPLVLAAIAAACASGAYGDTKSPNPPARLAGVPMPPRFVVLSEKEARQVIVAEARKAGLRFSPDILKVTLPGTKPNATDDPTPSGREITITLDGTDKKHNVSYEYVSEADLKALKGKGLSPIWSGTPGRAVNYLNAFFPEAKPKGYNRAFTAARDVQPDGPNAERRAKAAAREDLRKQVKDFVNWLKVHGVI